VAEKHGIYEKDLKSARIRGESLIRAAPGCPFAFIDIISFIIMMNRE
jgi:hypothetical protein